MVTLLGFFWEGFSPRQRLYLGKALLLSQAFIMFGEPMRNNPSKVQWAAYLASGFALYWFAFRKWSPKNPDIKDMRGSADEIMANATIGNLIARGVTLQDQIAFAARTNNWKETL
jgi:hypothetical protein